MYLYIYIIIIIVPSPKVAYVYPINHAISNGKKKEMEYKIIVTYYIDWNYRVCARVLAIDCNYSFVIIIALSVYEHVFENRNLWRLHIFSCSVCSSPTRIIYKSSYRVRFDFSSCAPDRDPTAFRSHQKHDCVRARRAEHYFEFFSFAFFSSAYIMAATAVHPIFNPSARSILCNLIVYIGTSYTPANSAFAPINKSCSRYGPPGNPLRSSRQSLCPVGRMAPLSSPSQYYLHNI